MIASQIALLDAAWQRALSRGSDLLGAPNSGAGFYFRLGPHFGSTSF